MNLDYIPNNIYEKYFKRFLDVILSSFAIVLFSPIFIIIALLVKLNLGSPILFLQERVGKDEKIFNIYKFRSMTIASGKKDIGLSDEDRLTNFGRKLRATSLDELPELFNILKGEMSIVGPRPLLVKYLPYYSNEQRRRHRIRPGLTGYAQVQGRNSITWDERLSFDLKYVEHITFLNDLKIILITLWKVLRKEGITSKTSETMEDFVDYVMAKRKNE